MSLMKFFSFLWICNYSNEEDEEMHKGGNETGRAALCFESADILNHLLVEVTNGFSPLSIFR